jgi:hypothetical protein
MPCIDTSRISLYFEDAGRVAFRVHPLVDASRTNS